MFVLLVVYLFVFDFGEPLETRKSKDSPKSHAVNVTSICDDVNFAVGGQNTDEWFESRFIETLIKHLHLLNLGIDIPKFNIWHNNSLFDEYYIIL